MVFLGSVLYDIRTYGITIAYLKKTIGPVYLTVSCRPCALTQ